MDRPVGATGADARIAPEFPETLLMPPGALYSQRFPMALAYSAVQHAAQRRKDDWGTPYFSHPAAVAASVWRYGGRVDALADELEDLAIAGVLHDVAEDAGGPAAVRAIEDLFGRRVAQVVVAASDALPEPGQAKAPWEERKRGHIARMSRLARGDAGTGLAADPGACLVIACDKLDNLSDTVRSVARQGERYLDRFNAPPDRVRWYYASAIQALRPALPEDLVEELDRQLAALGA